MMNCGRGLVWLAVAVQALPCSGAPRVKTVDARWEELRSLVLDRHVKVSDDGGKVTAGVVEQVTDDHIHLRVRSVADAPATATQSLFRGTIQTIEFQRVQGKGRAFWSALLAVAGAALGLLLGAAETFGEDGGGTAVAVTGAIGVGGAAAGYAIGRHRDTHTVIVRIVP